MFILGYLFNQELQIQQSKNIQKENKIEYKLKPENNQNYNIADVKNEVEPIVLPDFEALSKQFYTYLTDCEPLNVVSENGYESYIIEGINGNNCHFKHRQVGFVDTICNLPLDMAKKYAAEGIGIINQLEELRSQNKTGFVGGSEYITEINNNKNYCRLRFYEHNKPKVVNRTYKNKK